jgi:hypothetical protein
MVPLSNFRRRRRSALSHGIRERVNQYRYGRFSDAIRRAFSTDENSPIHSSTGSDHSSRSSEAKLFGIEFSDLHVSKEDSVKPRRDQLDAQLFEAEYFADEDSVLVPVMSPLLLTRRSMRPFGYVNSGNLRGSRIELGM